MKLVRPTLESLVVKRPEPTTEQPQGMCLDKAYDYQAVRDILVEFGFTAHIRSRGEEAQAIRDTASQKARRWVVERTQSARGCTAPQALPRLRLTAWGPSCWRHWADPMPCCAKARIAHSWASPCQPQRWR